MSQRTHPEPLKLGSWLFRQRQTKNGKLKSVLSAAQIHRLEQLGVCWEQRTISSWEEYFAALVRYKDGDGETVTFELSWKLCLKGHIF